MIKILPETLKKNYIRFQLIQIILINKIIILIQ